MKDLIPEEQPARFGIDLASPGCDMSATWLRQGAEFVCELNPGDSWIGHPAGGVIVCNPESKPVWHHVVDGVRVRDVLEPGQWPAEASGGKVFMSKLDPALPGQVVSTGVPVEQATIGMQWSPD